MAFPFFRNLKMLQMIIIPMYISDCSTEDFTVVTQIANENEMYLLAFVLV